MQNSTRVVITNEEAQNKKRLREITDYNSSNNRLYEFDSGGGGQFKVKIVFLKHIFESVSDG